jgi:hypothetical protein
MKSAPLILDDECVGFGSAGRVVSRVAPRPLGTAGVVALLAAVFAALILNIIFANQQFKGNSGRGADWDCGDTPYAACVKRVFPAAKDLAPAK